MTFRAKVKPCAAALVAAVVIAGSGGVAVRKLAAGEPASAGAAAGKPTADEERKGPLAALPSAPGPHIEKIKVLGDNQWLNLGAPAADPKWGEARGRAWGGRSMTCAPDLSGAFFCGEGIHAFVKPDGHYMDDLWFYDANAHRWICLHPGTDVKAVALKLDENGFEVDRSGNFVPVAYLGHAYGRAAYDPDRKQYAILPQCGTWWAKAMPHRGEWLGVPRDDWGKPYKNGKLNLHAKHPIFYDVLTGVFVRRFSPGPGGPPMRGSDGEGLVQFVQSQKRLLCARGDKIWFYDHASGTWEEVQTGGDKVSASYENGCYDARRERLYVAGAEFFGYHDLKVGKWTEVKAEGQPEDFKSTLSRCLTYDTVNDVLLYCENRFVGKDKGAPVMAAYLPDENKWVALPAAPSFPMAGIPGKFTKAYGLQGLLHGFYHPELNAHFYYLAPDSGTGGAMLVYRYRQPKE